jgi:hypothetical protein
MTFKRSIRRSEGPIKALKKRCQPWGLVSTEEERQRTAALQNLAEILPPNDSRERPGVRLSSAAFHFSPIGTLIATFLIFLAGCACPQRNIHTARPFDFQNDTFAFANQLRWVYEYDDNGKWTTHTRYPKATYSQHCFVVARSARQFYENAVFAPSQPVANDSTYRRLIRKVVSSDPRHPASADRKIIIPGYANLHEFSAAQESLLKQECGGAWQSYFQRGHWRIMLPFRRAQQQRVAGDLLQHATHGEPVVVHIVRFPQLTINHAVIFFDAKESAEQIEFKIYDPNLPAEPRIITYDKQKRTFFFAPNDYFPGGRIDAYEIYNQWNY